MYTIFKFVGLDSGLLIFYFPLILLIIPLYVVTYSYSFLNNVITHLINILNHISNIWLFRWIPWPGYLNHPVKKIFKWPARNILAQNSE